MRKRFSTSTIAKIILLFICLLLFNVEAKQRGKGSQKAKNAKDKKVSNANKLKYNALIEQAKVSTECVGLLVSDLSNMCAKYKLSPECFVTHFGATGLEFGEEDV